MTNGEPVSAELAVSPPGSDAEGGPRATLILALGSTQTFLAQARRTQDLWQGSFLTSYLAYRALKPLLERKGCEVVMPAVENQPLRLADQAPGSTKIDLDRFVIANFPNTFTAIVPTDALDDVVADCIKAPREAIRCVARKVFEALSDAGWMRTGGNRDGEDDVFDRLWAPQLQSLIDHMGVYWAAFEWSHPPAGESAIPFLNLSISHVPKTPYALANAMAARGLVVRKNIRDFPPAAGPEEGQLELQKCTQCGLRLQVKPTFDDLPERIRSATSSGGRKVKLEGRIRRGDRLCAVCLTKRLAWEHYFLPTYGSRLKGPASPDRHLLFPSTSSIAAAPFKRAVLECWDELRIDVERFLNDLHGIVADEHRAEVFFPSADIPLLRTIADGTTAEGDSGKEFLEGWLRLDGSWLFPEELENLTPDGIEREYGVPAGDGAGDQIAKARRSLKRLLGVTAAKGIPPPFPYFAVLAADGDRMSAWKSGTTGPDPTGAPFQVTEAYHRALAEGLRRFALDKAPKALQKGALGRLIYAGGDDVLALLPVAGAVEAASGLQKSYPPTIMGCLSRAAALPGGAQGMPDQNMPTMSAAILVAHRKHPFSHVVERAEWLLKEVAKESAGRDALVVAVSPRSGVERVMAAKWTLKQDARFPETLLELVGAFSTGRLSRGVVHALDQASAGVDSWDELPDGSLEGKGKLRRLQEGEIRRTLKRRAAEEATGERLWEPVRRLLEAVAPPLANEIGPVTTWGRLVEALAVAEFLGRAHRIDT